VIVIAASGFELEIHGMARPATKLVNMAGSLNSFVELRKVLGRVVNALLRIDKTCYYDF
jgi:phosphotransferase system HPr-like phosphotransfer protein